MKINEIIVESKDEIEVMLALKGKSVSIIKQLVDAEVAYYKNDIPYTRTKLQSLCQLLDGYINDIETIATEYLSEYFDDPDVDDIINEFYDLDQYILSILDSLNK